MLRKFMMLVVALVPLAFLPVPRAMAATPELTCNIQPNSNDIFHPVQCGTTKVASSYSIDYYMQGVSDPATFAWTLVNGGTVVPGTCTSTTNICIITVRGLEEDQSLTAIAAVTTDGTTTSYSVTAWLNAVCGNMFC